MAGAGAGSKARVRDRPGIDHRRPLEGSRPRRRSSIPALSGSRAPETLACMDDQTAELEILRAMTPARKLAVMNALIRQAWLLKAAVLRDQHPELDAGEIEARARLAVAGE